MNSGSDEPLKPSRPTGTFLFLGTSYATLKAVVHVSYHR
jgi:hypothetical protein